MADIQHLISIDAGPDKVLSLISSADGFSQWWAEDSTSRAEGSVELGFFSKGTVYRMRLSKTTHSEVLWKVESGSEWSGTEIRFLVEPANSGIRLRFVHSNWKKETEYFTVCNTTWGELMYRLKAAAEGRKPGPLFTATGLAA